MLFNKNNDPRGINFEEFGELCESLGIHITKQKVEEFFTAASKDNVHITFNDFAAVMRKENYH